MNYLVLHSVNLAVYLTIFLLVDVWVFVATENILVRTCLTVPLRENLF